MASDSKTNLKDFEEVWRKNKPELDKLRSFQMSTEVRDHTVDQDSCKSTRT